jgi:hypothetical protein
MAASVEPQTPEEDAALRDLATTHRRRWDARFAADRRRLELQHQLWQMEGQIREERLSDEEREWRRRYREEQAEVKRKARRRLGLPKEDPRC